MLISPKIFAVLMILLCLGNVIGYASMGDWRKAVYWTASIVMVVVITW